MINESEALAVFAALAQETRLRVLRLLIEAGSDGVSAGRIATAVACSPSNLSFHLSHLERARLVRSRREAKLVVYSAVHGTIAEMVDFLMANCCAGRPELCEPIVVPGQPCCGPAETAGDT